ncbi:hypothetical protein J6590_094643 [Homalodisca vitripennis]|nr:hypothetical protein J6590_094643 [Homalodisca vitripennis]
MVIATSCEQTPLERIVAEADRNDSETPHLKTSKLSPDQSSSPSTFDVPAGAFCVSTSSVVVTISSTLYQSCKTTNINQRNQVGVSDQRKRKFSKSSVNSVRVELRKSFGGGERQFGISDVLGWGLKHKKIAKAFCCEPRLKRCTVTLVVL